MNQLSSKRIESLDLLKGLVIIIMALDHTRDYFHYEAFYFDPTDPEKTNLALFFTRWITHFCAPAFSLLAGTSAYLVGRRKSKNELCLFLLKRGLWLIIIEFTVVIFGWSFNIYFNSIGLLVIWSLGISMIFLAAIIYLPKKYILAFSLLMIFGHNILDYISIEDNMLWSIIHERGRYVLFDTIKIRVVYPIIPWIGVMSFGYYLGTYYDKTIEAKKRQKSFIIIGSIAILLFIIIRLINEYGNPKSWHSYDQFQQTMFSFMDPLKYPPSVTYLLMTLGPTIIFLGLAENVKGRLVGFISVFGKVPFFIYIIHIYVIHFFAMILAEITGFGWKSMILDDFVSTQSQLVGFGINLWGVYLVWISIILMLYPLCKRFSEYKLAHKEKWWLSYF
ncbi:heparan-alpha-glucosaminide N-acetyltransferase domain-containing protein [Mangrovivirga sp. M17]|uniref:Heparan-alpha-glucosaminide N-acetyltransferase domain-containing protein n=1 Tax=Mangrovivirga halotolerans TaxID=2993936 RepID=A0ABT3RP03_9BACT|nr:heparan-alpha-glucosaminide N-acetyltransferase domain-containing protein [Mangrovivirga halotolerans]MCX2743322.1 heparan-alpha-glucosaminide N-acetyltransferase domain-containing protein [Mangrovivirga halotolerans]